jgi:hypothetical protein
VFRRPAPGYPFVEEREMTTKDRTRRAMEVAAKLPPLAERRSSARRQASLADGASAYISRLGSKRSARRLFNS